MSASRLKSIITWLTVLSVSTIAVFSFILSYTAQVKVAVSYEIELQRARLYPIILDGAIVAFSLTLLRNSLDKVKSRRRWLWFLITAFTSLSVVYNVLAHHGSGFWAWLLAGFPPVALLLSFETLMYQLGLEQQVLVKVEKLEARRDKKAQSEPEEDEEPDDIEERAKWLVHQNPTISGAELGRQLGVSSRSGRRLKREYQNTPKGSTLEMVQSPDDGHGADGDTDPSSSSD